MPCSTPVALLLFNRPDCTRQVFEAVRQARPGRLFLIADGPRHAADAPLCAAARAAVQDVNWPCKVQRLYSESNLGCGRGPVTGIDWVFSQVEEAIILEDDCVPSSSFFRFCDELLARYRQDTRIMHISGGQLGLSPASSTYSYSFSKYTLCGWGWATWARAWRHYDYYLHSWPQFQVDALSALCPDPIEAAFWRKKLGTLYDQKRNDAWDYQWNYAVWTQGGLAVIPAVNLVANVGMGPTATHTKVAKPWMHLPAGDLGELKHPEVILPDVQADAQLFDQHYGGHRWRQRGTLKHLVTKPKRLFSKLRSRLFLSS